MRNVKLLGLVALVITQMSCTSKTNFFGKMISEGRIDYGVTFPLMEEDNVMRSILPDKMSIFFKDNKYNSEFNTYGGVFKNKVCIDTQQESYSQMLKIFKKRLACDYTELDLQSLLRESPPFTIIKSARVDTLAGIPCKVAKGVFYDIDTPPIDIYYTDKIEIDNPNWCTPFAELDGFLLGYELNMFDMRMKLIAENLEEVKVDATDFEVDEDYKKVSYKYIRIELESLMESFDI